MASLEGRDLPPEGARPACRRSLHLLTASQRRRAPWSPACRTPF